MRIQCQGTYPIKNNMLKTPSNILVLLSLFVFSFQLTAGARVTPHVGHNDIISAFSGKSSIKTQNKKIYATSLSDNAGWIVYENIIVKALSKSEFFIPPAENELQQKVQFTKGTFHVLAGSQKMQFEIGEFVFEVSSVEFFIQKINNGWLLDVVNCKKGTEIVIIRKTTGSTTQNSFNPDKSNSQPDNDSDTITETSSQLKKFTLKVGKVYLLDKSGKITDKENKKDKLILNKHLALFNDAERPLESYLIDIENPEDLIVKTSGKKADDFANIEEMEIEMEAGCVEICVD